jgi:hypothetical protein
VQKNKQKATAKQDAIRADRGAAAAAVGGAAAPLHLRRAAGTRCAGWGAAAGRTRAAPAVCVAPRSATPWPTAACRPRALQASDPFAELADLTGGAPASSMGMLSIKDDDLLF